MTALPPRQMDILEIARREGRVDVETLAHRFEVTPQTIRKDLNDLCDIEKLNRVHGGAVFPSNTVNMAYQARREIAADGKARIAQGGCRSHSGQFVADPQHRHHDRAGGAGAAPSSGV